MNEQMQLAWDFVSETGRSVFLTGKAGTGKTTFLRRLRRECPKRMVVLAPTGVAAINAEGQTLHSFFQLPFGPIVPGVEMERKEKNFRMSKDKKNLIRTLDLLVIDEISMVRSDLLDAVDAELRKYRDRYKPFGGVQLLLIGDLRQLAPVAKDSEWELLREYYDTPYFYGSKALRQIEYVTIELQQVYRQQDQDFIDILGRIRSGNIDTVTEQALSARYIPRFVPPQAEDWIRLTTHNRQADLYNEQMLASLPGSEHELRATIRGNFPESSYPAEERLVLKEGAQVMFLKNDTSAAHAYYNGKIAVVTGFYVDSDTRQEVVVVTCKEDGTSIRVSPAEWENTRYVLNPDTGAIEEVSDGTFTQVPLRLAWAITIHKSQGLTFEHAVLDINDSFSHGQAYVALSRCRTLEGLVLTRPFARHAVICDRMVVDFMDREIEAATHSAERLPQLQREYQLYLLDELFGFDTLMRDLAYLTRVVDEHLYRDHADLLEACRAAQSRMAEEIVSVAHSFRSQYMSLLTRDDQPMLRERVQKASEYFHGRMIEIFMSVARGCIIDINNQQVAKQYQNALDAFRLSLQIKMGVFHTLTREPYSTSAYLAAKAKAALGELTREDKKPTRKKSAKSTATPSEKPELSDQVKAIIRARAIAKWRAGKK